MYTAPAMPWLDVRKDRPLGEAAEIDRLLAASDALSTKVRREFMAAVKRLGDKVDLRRVADLIRAGRINEALDVVDQAHVEASFKPVSAALTRALVDAGSAAAKSIPMPALRGVEFTFGMTNPRTVDFLRQYEFGLIRQLSAEARGAVANTIRAGITAGRNPLDVARDVRGSIGLTARQAQAVANYRTSLSKLSGDALQRALRDRRFDPTVQAAIESGSPLSGKQIERIVDRYEQKYLKHRAETIARTEATRAVNAGNRQAWQQAVDEGVLAEREVRRKWYYSRDEKTRDAHIAIPGLNPDGVGLNEPFDSPLGPILYPGDPAADPENTINCRCTQIIRYRAVKAGARP